MSNYKEEYSLNDNSGELTVNGKPKVQFYKNYLFPEQNGQSPDISSLNPAGPDFNVMDNVLYFFNKLKMDSKIPYARFASRGSTPVNYQAGIDALERDEVRFEKFLRRLRSIFQEILVKPLYIQMCLDFPELSKDRAFKANLGLNFHKDSELESMIELANYKKRGEFIAGLLEMKVKVGEEEKSYFDNNFLIQRYLGLNPEQTRINEEYKKREAKEAEKAGAAAGGEAAGGEAAPAAGGETEEAPAI
jgi:hypothetical protein